MWGHSIQKNIYRRQTRRDAQRIEAKHSLVSYNSEFIRFHRHAEDEVRTRGSGRISRFTTTAVLPGRNGERGWTDGNSLRRSEHLRSPLTLQKSRENRQEEEPEWLTGAAWGVDVPPSARFVEEHAGVVDSQSVGGDTRVVSVIVLCDVCYHQQCARAADLNTDALRAGQSDKHTTLTDYYYCKSALLSDGRRTNTK